jgi:hypothetical protein
MKCKCNEITELDGAEAKLYAQHHLKKVRVDGNLWQIEYECLDTGVRWILDYPHSEYHGGGSPRLRKVDITSESK